MQLRAIARDQQVGAMSAMSAATSRMQDGSGDVRVKTDMMIDVAKFHKQTQP